MRTPRRKLRLIPTITTTPRLPTILTFWGVEMASRTRKARTGIPMPRKPKGRGRESFLIWTQNRTTRKTLQLRTRTTLVRRRGMGKERRRRRRERARLDSLLAPETKMKVSEVMRSALMRKQRTLRQWMPTPSWWTTRKKTRREERRKSRLRKTGRLVTVTATMTGRNSATKMMTMMTKIIPNPSILRWERSRRNRTRRLGRPSTKPPTTKVPGLLPRAFSLMLRKLQPLRDLRVMNRTDGEERRGEERVQTCCRSARARTRRLPLLNLFRHSRKILERNG
mmetsp:Transcript_7478/g.10529  ORF Transcript_7478/g.10529 Transcript_7478/m.10529 type:complete len:281 (-) Transcript_7478:20-862(-)